MLSVLIGAVLNICLDPLFIFVLHMGVRGAAVATVLSQAVSAIWVVHFLVSEKSVMRLTLKNMHLKKIYDPETLNTNHQTLAVLKEQGIDGAFLAREIPLKEKQMIGQKSSIKTMVQIHGVEYMAYSKRKLLSNYKEFTHLDFLVDKEAQIEIKANGVDEHCHIYEDFYGTHITSTNQMCALDVLNQFLDFDYLLIDGQYISETDLLEIVHLYKQGLDAISNNTYNKESLELIQLLYRLTPNIHYYHSFLFDSTVYKIADVRKREENERS